MIAVVLFLLTPLFSQSMVEKRGYFAIGGECLLWLYPVIAWVICDTWEEKYE